MAGDEYNDTQADSDFSDGFKPATTAPASPATGSGAEPAAPPDTKPASAKEDGTAPAATDPPAAPAASPEYIQITKDDWELVKSAASKTAGIESQLSKAFGTIGNMQQLVNQLKAATPAGAAVELPADLLSDIEKEYPDLAQHLKGVFEKAFKGTRGTGTATAANQEAIQSAVSDTVTKAVAAIHEKAEEKALDELHPDWREVVGAVAGGVPQDNPFRKWLATQPTDYQKRINDTNSSAVISRAIDKFQAAKPPAPPPATPPKNTAQADRIRGAVQPKGDGGQPAPAKTEDDDFNDGFRNG